MKVFAEKTVMRQELDEVRCNVCGRGLHRNEAGYWEDYLSFTKTWGYHSPIDGETHEADVCVECYKKWVETFTIPV